MTTTTTKTQTTITITPAGDLHLRYGGQCEPQHVYLILDCERGEMSCEPDPEIGGGASERVWGRRVLRWRIPLLRSRDADSLMQRIMPLAERVVAGYSRRWDGSRDVGRLDSDAEQAHDEIGRVIERIEPTLETWDALEWICSIGSVAEAARDVGITATTTDDELAAIGERLEAQSRNEGVDQLEDMDHALESLRTAARKAAAADAAQDEEIGATMTTMHAADWIADHYGGPEDCARALGIGPRTDDAGIDEVATRLVIEAGSVELEDLHVVLWLARDAVREAAEVQA